MDLIPPCRCRRASGIPRTRGDGPSRGAGAGAGVSGAAGFPARAGMDPRRSRRAACRIRIPRTRGDGPSARPRTARGSTDSPHARGWTSIRDDEPGLAPGFPARAGMDRGRGRPRRGGRRIPRTRGDGPLWMGAPRHHPKDSPHARGWTENTPGQDVHESGFPARAGMDPVGGGAQGGWLGIPRTRGDGPRADWTRPSFAGDSPHARGWTLATVDCAGCMSGFPARAGMDPLTPRSSPSWTGIPRTRGDGPRSRPTRYARASDSPHARGWTSGSCAARSRACGFPARAGMDRLPDRRGGGGRGFPARAGMDPCPARGRPGRTRIPRTRGDGPSSSIDSATAVRDSPHARGWTLEVAMSPSCARGFPARAGMDHRDKARKKLDTRIPRTRGDGPLDAAAARTAQADSPHARGWTLHRGGGDRPGRGFPARAGMDRDDPAPAADRGRIPRTRGDGPTARPSALARGRDSPHARGWTRAVRSPPRAPRGFPARAGMDPRRCRTPCAPGRIPRTRGDGPSAARACIRLFGDSPHARGWTRVMVEEFRGLVGFPARAGMDPRSRRCGRPWMWIPRTRGDGPRTTAALAGGATDSPHARGWTQPPSRRTRSPTGFPARAGMDPDFFVVCCRSSGIPRTRGDGPPTDSSRRRSGADSPHARGWTRLRRRARSSGTGFPARAGMDPTGWSGVLGGGWIPRTRGDGPSMRPRDHVVDLDSPHARGWTRRGRGPAAPVTGFPARAGMDPPDWGGPGVWRWIPRTRGDGPSTHAADGKLREDSPHARGWTPVTGTAVSHGDGFPARAGMDPRPPRSSRTAARIPRTRGDGPAARVSPAVAPEDSPHARGWTRGPEA